MKSGLRLFGPNEQFACEAQGVFRRQRVGMFDQRKPPQDLRLFGGTPRIDGLAKPAHVSTSHF